MSTIPKHIFRMSIAVIISLFMGFSLYGCGGTDESVENTGQVQQSQQPEQSYEEPKATAGSTQSAMDDIDSDEVQANQSASDDSSIFADDAAASTSNSTPSALDQTPIGQGQEGNRMCPHCGLKNASTATFCTYCGVQIPR